MSSEHTTRYIHKIYKAVLGLIFLALSQNVMAQDLQVVQYSVVVTSTIGTIIANDGDGKLQVEYSSGQCQGGGFSPGCVAPTDVATGFFIQDIGGTPTVTIIPQGGVNTTNQSVIDIIARIGETHTYVFPGGIKAHVQVVAND